jgi:hypothetical protein
MSVFKDELASAVRKKQLRALADRILFHGEKTRYKADQFAHLCQGVAGLLPAKDAERDASGDQNLHEEDRRLLFEVMQDLFLERRVYFDFDALQQLGTRTFFFSVRQSE